MNPVALILSVFLLSHNGLVHAQSDADACAPCDPCSKCGDCVPSCTPCKPCFALLSPANPSPADTPGCETCEQCTECQECFGFCGSGKDDTCESTGCEVCEPCLTETKKNPHSGFNIVLPPLNPQENATLVPSSALRDGDYIPAVTRDTRPTGDFDGNDFPDLNTPFVLEPGMNESYGMDPLSTSASTNGKHSKPAAPYVWTFSLLGLAAVVVLVIVVNKQPKGVGFKQQAATVDTEVNPLAQTSSDYGSTAGPQFTFRNNL